MIANVTDIEGGNEDGFEHVTHQWNQKTQAKQLRVFGRINSGLIPSCI